MNSVPLESVLCSGGGLTRRWEVSEATPTVESRERQSGAGRHGHRSASSVCGVDLLVPSLQFSPCSLQC